MKHLFIVNPIAGGRDKTDEVRSKVLSAFAQRNDDYEIYITKAPRDATDKIKYEAGRVEHLRVYACGGDGTFNECAAGAALRDNVAVCPFPTGTGNDFCRMFGKEAELYRDLDKLLDGYEHPIDYIDCDGRCSVNICSVGIDARIGCDVHKYSSLPLIGGAAGYVVSAAVNMFKGISRTMEISCGDFHEKGSFSLVCACNGRYYGGGFNPSPTAMPDDGILDIFIVKKVSIIQFAALIGKYAAGRADEIKNLVTHLHSDSIRIRFEEDNVVNLDGEAYYTSDADMKLVPGGLRLIVPEGMKFFAESRELVTNSL